MKTRILKYGFEIEGEYSERLSREVLKYGTIKGDGSVNNCKDNEQMYCRRLHTAEFASSPYLINSHVPSSVFAKFQKAYINEGYHWNESCGFHVHVSFKPKIPPEIFSTQFAEYFYSRMKKVFPKEFKDRRNNGFCKAENPVESIAKNDGNRYRGINFRPAMEKHGTIEFRIFPANEPEKMQRYCSFIIRTLRAFLKNEIREAQEINENDVPLRNQTQELRDETVIVVNEIENVNV